MSYVKLCVNCNGKHGECLVFRKGHAEILNVNIEGWRVLSSATGFSNISCEKKYIHI